MTGTRHHLRGIPVLLTAALAVALLLAACGRNEEPPAPVPPTPTGTEAPGPDQPAPPGETEAPEVEAPPVAPPAPPEDEAAVEPPGEVDVRARIAAEAAEQLRKGVLPYWFPRCIDKELGGYHLRFAPDWSETTDKGKTLVHTARLTWVAAAVSDYDPKLRDAYLGYARHGVDFLVEHFQDAREGGLYWDVTLAGEPIEGVGMEKHLYSTAFGIYAGATVYGFTKDERALELAKTAFGWLDQHAHDPEGGGYWEAMTRAGEPIKAQDSPGAAASGRDRNYVPYGRKTINAHMHVLESFTELYRVWPDEALRERLEEVLALVRDKTVQEPGYMAYYYTPDWKPLEGVPGFNSFGHDVETALLMLRALDVLGRPDDEKTVQVARQVVDFALEHGWDETLGGLFNKKTATEPQPPRGKVCWAQAEALNVLLAMDERFGAETDRYWQEFVKLWDFVRDHAVDKEFGGWYTNLEEDGRPLGATEKSENWHCSRMLMNLARSLAQTEADGQ